MNLLEEYSNKKNFEYYTGIIYKNIIFNNTFKNYYNFSLYGASILQIYNNSINSILKDYTFEKNYLLNNIIIDWTRRHFNKTNRYFFIYSWNNYLKVII